MVMMTELHARPSAWPIEIGVWPAMPPRNLGISGEFSWRIDVENHHFLCNN